MCQLFLDENTDGVIGVDCKGIVRSWNNGAERIYGYTAAEALLRNISFLFPPSGTAGNQQFIDPLDCLGTWETEQVCKSGKIIHVSFHVLPLLEDNGITTGNCIVAREITPQRLHQIQLRQVQKLEAVGLLAGGIAHDFNNLLTVISGYNSMIRDELSPESALFEYTSEVEKAANHATMMTNKLLAFSRREVTQRQILNLNDMAQDMRAMMGRILGKNICLRLSLAPDLANIKADPGQMSQLMMNLLINAKDAMPGGGIITITTSNIAPKEPATPAKSGVSHVQMTIADNGTGMSPATLEHLFEPFFTTKPRGKGTGLGLATVYGIISQMRGEVRVASTLGEGSMFTICLPTTSEEKPDVKPPDIAPLNIGAAEGDTILVVEDEDGVRRLLTEILVKQGYKVYGTPDPDEAQRICRTINVHLLVTDVVMPVMNGMDLAARIIRINPGIKVLYISGYLDPAVYKEALLESDVNLLRKPFNTETLLLEVRKAIQQCGIPTLSIQ
jgi:PAS domain S-box-containing protein